MKPSRHLYLQIYLTIVAGLLAVVLVGGLLWRVGTEGPRARHAFAIAGELASIAVPPADAPLDEQRTVLRRLHDRLRIDLAIYGADRQLIASAGPPLPRPPALREHGGFIYGPGGAAWALALPDGRWLVARAQRPPGREALGFLGFLAVMALLIALAALPVARRLTGRLERLQSGVEQLGSGDLSARVEVEGRDEVARLATSFNAAAARIEQLVESHKMLLANASHELRTPLSRIRLGLELMQSAPSPERRTAIEADVSELETLIEEILLSSRLDALHGPEVLEEVDLLALAAEEVARYDGATLEGRPAMLRGDPRLLRRLLRNLLDNASHHGKPPIAVAVRSDGGGVLLDVSDAGPGIPVADRERVFEPFRRAAGSRMRTGSGLGLTLVRQIARSHGGDVAITGPGSRIAVRLPSEPPRRATTAGHAQRPN